jgi:hypothetical protein
MTKEKAMKTVPWKLLAAALVLCGMTASGDDKGNAESARVVKLPVLGVKAACCDSAAGKELEALPGVTSVTFEKDDSGKRAVIRLKTDAALELSKVQEALATATKAMGKSMGTEYTLDTSTLPVDATVVFRAATVTGDDKARREKELGGLKGFDACTVQAEDKDSSAVTVTFKEKSVGTLDQVTKAMKAAGITLKEVVFHVEMTGGK